MKSWPAGDVTIFGAYDGYEIVSFSVELTGGYAEVLRTLRSFEQNTDGMRLASVRFESQLNRQLRKKRLKTFLHVQHLQYV